MPRDVPQHLEFGAAATLHRIRIGAEFAHLCDEVGFDRAVEAVQQEIRRVACERRGRGQSTGGFVG